MDDGGVLPGPLVTRRRLFRVVLGVAEGFLVVTVVTVTCCDRLSIFNPRRLVLLL
jgi:hypothetical protein